MREASHKAMRELLRGCRPGEHTLVAAATDSSALGVLDAVREAGLEAQLRDRGTGLHSRSDGRDARRDRARWWGRFRTSRRRMVRG